MQIVANSNPNQQWLRFGATQAGCLCHSTPPSRFPWEAGRSGQPIQAPQIGFKASGRREAREGVVDGGASSWRDCGRVGGKGMLQAMTAGGRSELLENSGVVLAPFYSPEFSFFMKGEAYGV